MNQSLSNVRLASSAMLTVGDTLAQLTDLHQTVISRQVLQEVQMALDSDKDARVVIRGRNTGFGRGILTIEICDTPDCPHVLITAVAVVTTGDYLRIAEVTALTADWLPGSRELRITNEWETFAQSLLDADDAEETVLEIMEAWTARQISESFDRMVRESRRANGFPSP